MGKTLEELEEELRIHDKMLTAIVKLLEEKNILTQEEVDSELKKKLLEAIELGRI